MTAKRFKLMAVVAGALVSSSLHAAPGEGFDMFTGNGFLQNCSQTLTSENGFRLGVCFGWLMGFLDQDGLKPANQRYICRPVDAPNRQLMDVVLKYLRENPEKRHWPIPMLAQNALVGAFPCNHK